MKKFVSLLLALLLTTACALPALAEEAQYASTRQFIQVLEKNNLKYTLGSVAQNQERITVAYTDDNLQTITFTLFFYDSNHSVHIRAWNVVDIAAGKNYALNILNQLNNAYNYAKFALDESDSTLTVSADTYFNDGNAGTIAYDLMQVLLDIITDDDCIAKLQSLQ